jgi:AhpD family alkylhydroperoxidase
MIIIHFKDNDACDWIECRRLPNAEGRPGILRLILAFPHLSAGVFPMTSHYYDKDDAQHRMDMAKLAPAEFKAWAALNNIVSIEDGAIPLKYRELIAIAVAHATACPYCIESHVKKGKAAGATKAEMSEAILLSAALCAGAAAAHGGLAMKFFDAA